VLVLLGPNGAGKTTTIEILGGRIVADGSADQLARQVSGKAQVCWSRDGERYVHSTGDATRFVRELFARHGEEITDLEVTRAGLEDTYMAMVHHHETGESAEAVTTFAEAGR
jgi:ABC-2 type transport system ATP-binding protein